MTYRILQTLSLLIVIALSPLSVKAEETNEHAQIECPDGNGGDTGGGPICICACTDFANGRLWDCSPNGCDAKEGKACERKDGPSGLRKTTRDEQKILQRAFPEASAKSFQQCLMVRSKRSK